MGIRVYGPFEFEKDRVNDKDYIEARWAEIGADREEHHGLGEACGVYVMSLRNGHSYNPVYVGRTSPAAGFAKRVFSDDKFRTVIHWCQTNRGVLTVHLLAKRKRVRSGFAVIPADDLEFLETFCIMCALRKNPKLANISKTRFSERLTIPGITGNLEAGHPGAAVISLRDAFNLIP